MKKIAIVGANGVPASYGGWDQLVEHFSSFETSDYQFIIYCTNKTNDNNLSIYNNAIIRVVHLDANGWQSIPYDIVSLYLAFRECDAAIMLGTSGSLFIPVLSFFKFPVFLNIDGAEWKRGKWNYFIKLFLKISEYIGVNFSRKVITDNLVLSDYVVSQYSKSPITIEYGGDHADFISAGELINQHDLTPNSYCFKVCRIVPENNLDMILDSFVDSDVIFVLVGNFDNSAYGRKLISKYKLSRNIKLLPPIYDQSKLNEIRSNCGLYIHGHSVGGTNPSLVEAMSLGLNIASFDVSYNRATTFGKSHFFKNESQLRTLINSFSQGELFDYSTEVKSLAKKHYTWRNIINKYITVLDKYL